MAQRKRYAVVGLGSRSRMFTTALLKEYADRAQLVAYCDQNQTRMDHYNNYYAKTLGTSPCRPSSRSEFEQMIKQQKVDCVIVTWIDRTHHHYIIRAMELGCDAITEKPMTIDAGEVPGYPRCDQKDRQEAHRHVQLPLRPAQHQGKEVLQSGAIGDITSRPLRMAAGHVHGADYFRRWHRDKRNSGGLMVHKATASLRSGQLVAR